MSEVLKGHIPHGSENDAPMDQERAFMRAASTERRKESTLAVVRALLDRIVNLELAIANLRQERANDARFWAETLFAREGSAND